MRTAIPLLLLTLLVAGCTAPGGEMYRLDGAGHLQVNVPAPEVVAEETILREGCVTLSRVVFSAGQGEVATLLAMPEEPVAAVVLAPGAGVLKEAHTNRSLDYARAGVACMVPDIRGMGGETPGDPVSIDEEIAVLEAGGTPQYFRVIGDLCAARMLLTDRTGVPVCLAGSSQGGRYAAVAAAADPGCAGFVGISTGGFDGVGEQYAGAAREFLLAVDPDRAIRQIAPRPVWIFHAPDDPIIPFAEGRRLFAHAGEPKEFIPFNGTHGINGEVDAELLDRCLQFYGPGE